MPVYIIKIASPGRHGRRATKRCVAPDLRAACDLAIYRVKWARDNVPDGEPFSSWAVYEPGKPGSKWILLASGKVD